MSRRRGWSGITVTDQFCGAGGSTLGAKRAGLEVRLGLNHWQLACDTYNTNHPDTLIDCADISASDPTRYPSTDVLITSPECTTHSPAGGNRRRQAQRNLFNLTPADDPRFARSRATMWDVPRFAEFHRYNLILVENVVEVLRWDLFDTWLRAMHVLGYRHKIVSLNSMFCWPTPQSRDRVYIVFWRKGNKSPDLELRPKAPCAKCCAVVEAVQSWKNGNTVGKYRRQYLYICPTCAREVTPFYYAALNAIDFTIPAERIGDRVRPLKDRTLQRIAYGLNKYGRRQLIIRTNMTSGVECRVRDLSEPHFAQTASWLDGFFQPVIVTAGSNESIKGAADAMPTQTATERFGITGIPFIVETAYSHSEGNRAATDGRIVPTMNTRQTLGLACPSPFLVKLRGTEASHIERSASGLDDPAPTMVASGYSAALVSPDFAPFITMRRGRDHAVGVEQATPTVTTGEHHMLIQGAAQLSMRDANAMRVAGLDEEMRTQGAAPQAALLSRAPFLVQYYGQQQASGVEHAVPTVSTHDRHALVSPDGELRVEDCYFRMLQPHEIGAAMAFPGTYKVLGTKRDQVKQFGNAVTPPAMDELLFRAVASIADEVRK